LYVFLISPMRVTYLPIPSSLLLLILSQSLFQTKRLAC
jgi:hypothetical protein